MTKNLILFLIVFSAAPICSMEITKAQYNEIQNNQYLKKKAVRLAYLKVQYEIIRDENNKKNQVIETYLDKFEGKTIQEKKDSFYKYYQLITSKYFNQKAEKSKDSNKAKKRILNKNTNLERINLINQSTGLLLVDDMSKTAFLQEINRFLKAKNDAEKRINLIEKVSKYHKLLAESTEQQINVTQRLGQKLSYAHEYRGISDNATSDKFLESERMKKYKQKVIHPLLKHLGTPNKINFNYKEKDLYFDLGKHKVLQSFLKVHMTLPEVIDGEYIENGEKKLLNIDKNEQAIVMRDYLDIYGLDFDKSVVVGNKIILKFKPKALEQNSKMWKKHNNYGGISDDSWHITILNNVKGIVIGDCHFNSKHFLGEKHKNGSHFFNINEKNDYLKKITDYIDDYIKNTLRITTF